jgi:hypothetical protein
VHDSITLAQHNGFESGKTIIAAALQHYSLQPAHKTMMRSL